MSPLVFIKILFKFFYYRVSAGKITIRFTKMSPLVFIKILFKFFYYRVLAVNHFTINIFLTLMKSPARS